MDARERGAKLEGLSLSEGNGASLLDFWLVLFRILGGCGAVW